MAAHYSMASLWAARERRGATATQNSEMAFLLEPTLLFWGTFKWGMAAKLQQEGVYCCCLASRLSIQMSSLPITLNVRPPLFSIVPCLQRGPSLTATSFYSSRSPRKDPRPSNRRETRRRGGPEPRESRILYQKQDIGVWRSLWNRFDCPGSCHLIVARKGRGCSQRLVTTQSKYIYNWRTTCPSSR
jgi:hypothetical protein